MPSCPAADFDNKHNRIEIVVTSDDLSGTYQGSFTGQLISDIVKMNTFLPDYFNNYRLQRSDEKQVFYIEPRSSKRYYLIADKFISEFRQKVNKIFAPDYDTNFVLNNSLYLIKELINIGVESISFEFTEDQSILFTSKLSGSNIYCEVYFDNENELNEIEVITNIYKGHKQIFTSTSDLAGAINQINSRKSQIENEAGATLSYGNLPEPTRPAEPLPDYRSLQLAAF